MLEDEELASEELTPSEDVVVEETLEDGSDDSVMEHSNYHPGESGDGVKYHLTGMYQDWFLDYASYVILDRALPEVYDGLKPVQRRILHSLYELEDGRFNKVANVVGNTMKYHPHGDSSIYGALVCLAQDWSTRYPQRLSIHGHIQLFLR